MRLSAILLVAILTACGGGGSEDTSTPVVDAPTETSAEPEVSLSSDAPSDDLTAYASAASQTTATQAATVCGYTVGSHTLTGKVTAVYDGDTITVGSLKVRLDSIDAPELAQTYGQQSKQALSDRVLGKTVTVAYEKLDKYGRRVGSVFDGDCALVNLGQVRSGAAWYYEAYQCEISLTTRNEYALAQEYAQEHDLGLWAQPATAPWYYRNGTNPDVPVCSSTFPIWTWVASSSASDSSTAADSGSGTSGTGSGSGTGTTITTPTTSCTRVWVNSYRRSDGTLVHGYWRRKPGCA